MPTATEALSTLFDLLVVVIGFSSIVVIHELGHFLAARWAGIRVMAFAVGFGPAMFSYRKGIGFRRGSTEAEYDDRLGAELAKHADRDDHAAVRAEVSKTLSPTEYRLNALPLGGYVRMLGQEDLNPSAVSSANDSYQSVPVYKRMVVISAGVIFNLISAAIMFVAVFMIGLKVEPAVVGVVQAGSPAERAGILPGDTVVAVNGDDAQRFDDLSLATAMSEPGAPITLTIRRGDDPAFDVDVEPRKGRFTGLLEIGVGPAQTLRIADPGTRAGTEAMLDSLEREGLAGVEPGMRIVAVQITGDPPTEPQSFAELLDVYSAAADRPVTLTFASDDGREVVVRTDAKVELETGLVKVTDGWIDFEHIAGLTPVMRVAPDSEPNQGLSAGDVFARVGATEYPSIPRGIYEIRARTGEPIDITVVRDGVGRVDLDADVDRTGRVGFLPADTARVNTLLSKTPRIYRSVVDESVRTTPADDLVIVPGSRISKVAGVEVATFPEIRRVLKAELARAELTAAGAPLSVELEIVPPTAEGTGDDAAFAQTITIDAESAEDIAALGWSPPFTPALFEPVQTTLRASNPVSAVGMGLHETKRVLISTYLTFARLFQGTVKVEHLKGPVGIAHIGTIVAGRGPVWLVFFFALISVNLAVINFLPLPIVDGGQFLMLTYEQIRGKPVPIPVQNGLTLAGLIMIGSIFLIVTFNDISALLGF